MENLELIKQALSTIESVQSGKFDSKNPGKFEGESIATEYYYDCMLDGNDEIMELSPAEKLLFEIPEIYNWVMVSEDNNGFVTIQYYDNKPESEIDWENEEADFE